MDINRYLNLITSEHREQPNFITWLSAPLQIADDTVTMLKEFDSKFDLDLAVGSQLDILGSIVGVERVVNFQPTGGISPILDDESYKLVIKAKIAQNQWDGTLPGLTSIWSSIFPTVAIIVKDNLNMTADVALIGIGSTFERELTENGYIIPRPEGVKYNYYFTDNIIFGFDIDNSYYSGFDVGYWL